MQKDKKRKAEQRGLAEYKQANDRVVMDCHLELLNPTRICSCVGWGEAALIVYSARREWLKQCQGKLKVWTAEERRTEVQMDVCRSMWKSYQFYVVILESLIIQSNLFIKGDLMVQPSFFGTQEIREGEIRYVKN